VRKLRLRRLGLRRGSLFASGRFGSTSRPQAPGIIKGVPEGVKPWRASTICCGFS
jgi:hypothetical protein